jgi:Lipase maturation factor
MEDVRGYWLTRLLLERGIGIICLIAFLVALNQFRPLLGERGVLPVPIFVKQVPFRASPSLFYWFPRDAAFTAASWIGIVLSCLVITGVSARWTWSNVAVWLAIYLIYLSFVNVGQTFYAFGWESILLEACFFCIFLGGARVMPQAIPIWLFRWLLFRIMFGAGLIKLRGSVLARPYLPELSLRDAADAESAELVFPYRSGVGEQGRRAVQSFFGADRAVLLFPAAALCGDCGSGHDPVSVVHHRERQSVVAELAHAISGVLDN